MVEGLRGLGVPHFEAHKWFPSNIRSELRNIQDMDFWRQTWVGNEHLSIVFP